MDLLEDFFYAVRTANIESLEAFLRENPNWNFEQADPETGNTAIHYASANGSKEILQILLQKTFQVNVTNAQGNTPCHWACLNNHLEVVKMLCEAGANPFLENAFGRSAVEEAAFAGHEPIVTFITALYESAKAENE
jgi:ankyrin repeat protein